MAEALTSYLSTTPALPMDSIYQPYQKVHVEEIRNIAYIRGHIDGGNEAQQEHLKRGEALFKLAAERTNALTDALVKASEEFKITIYDFYLKIEDWDCVRSLIIVKMEDYLDEKIEQLYQVAYEKANEINSESFHWHYTITYFTENLNRSRIHTDGYTLLYEHTTRPREAQ